MGFRNRATGLVLMRELLEEKELPALEAFYAQLNLENRNLLQSASTVTWNESVNTNQDIVVTIANFLFPDKINPIKHLGKVIAQRAMKGIYSVFLSIPSTSFVFKRIGGMWSRYHQKGIVSLEDIESKSATMVVREYADMHLTIGNYLAGYIQGVLELTQAKNVKVYFVDKNPEAWKWRVKWD